MLIFFYRFLNHFCLKFVREEADTGECETRSRDSYSDSLSEDSESDKLWRWEGTSSEEGGFEQDNSNNNNNNNNNNNSASLHVNDRLGFLYFQYFERSAPYGRVPLMDKVNNIFNYELLWVFVIFKIVFVCLFVFFLISV